MIEVVPFSEALAVIGLQLNQPLPPEKLRAFHAALGVETNPDEWWAFCATAVRRFGWRFMPSVPELLDALEVHRGRAPLAVEATRAYERVLDSRTYTPEGGGTWVYSTVVKQCGVAAGVAFLAAGGNEAFTTTFGEDRRRERFVQAYTAEARACPAGRLPAVGAAPALPPGAFFSREEAGKVLEKLEAMAAALPPKEG